ncbi:MAG TPA: Fur family transcriptional regulator [Gaiellaceae bacterium]|jgi:Fur family ferric uptake transcriptional regulator
MAVRQAETRDLRALLQRSGLRATRQRLLVLDALAGEPSDATAQQIHERLRGAGTPIGLATVYRTLKSLAEADAIDSFSHHRGETCFRLCSEGHHHHLLCSECHRVVELEGCDLGAWLDEAAAAHGFVASDHRLEITGVCANCRR